MRGESDGYFTRLVWLLLICSLFPRSTPGDSAAQPATRELFEHRYQAWKTWIREHPLSSVVTGCAEFQAIVALGPTALPFILEKLELEQNPQDSALRSAVWCITWKRFPKHEWPEGTFGDPKTEAKMYLRWYANWQEDTRQRFDKAYERWKQLKRDSAKQAVLRANEVVYDDEAKTVSEATRTTRLGEVYQEMRDLGIAILPLIVDKLKARDYDLLPLLGQLTGAQGLSATGTVEERVAFTLAWWENSKHKWLIPVRASR
ncbi:MAG: hypothetical protein FJY85_18195 [Deltaproteobacteria bacterium]|nr:hypothetical protein [Deltaproteobacteria bacterium]